MRVMNIVPVRQPGGLTPFLLLVLFLRWWLLLLLVGVAVAQEAGDDNDKALVVDSASTTGDQNETNSTATSTAAASSSSSNANADVCSFDLQDACARCGWGVDILSHPSTTSSNGKTFSCSLPGLTEFAPGGQYDGLSANYLSYATDVSSPQLPKRAVEFEACTGGRIVFSEAADIFTNPVEDLGTATRQGSEVYDGYFMSYSHFPEVSALSLLEPLNDRIRRDNARLKWEDVLPKVKTMGEYRHRDGTLNLEFLMYDGDFFVPIVRLDLLERHNFPLPNSWDELVTIVKYFNGTDLNDDGETHDDWGFCHFPQAGPGQWDWWVSEIVYATWATFDQTQGTQEGFFFDQDSMEPRFGTSPAFRTAAAIWKDLWKHGTTAESDIFLQGRCAIGFAPPGTWKRVFLTPNGVHRTDPDDPTKVIWQPKMKSGEYAEPYRFKPFGTTMVHDRSSSTGTTNSSSLVGRQQQQQQLLVPCTPQRCPKAERVPAHGHLADDTNDNHHNDRASVLPASPLAGQLMNRAPFYWSGGLGTVIRKSAPQVKKDLLWDFFVYTNSPDTAVYDVANYRSWLDSWRYSQLQPPGDNFIQAGWSNDAYLEHANVMRWALSKDSNGAFNLRLPGLAKYTHEVVGQSMQLYIDDVITLDELIDQITQGWIEITDQEGKLDQLEIYRSSLGLEVRSDVDLCRLHRDLMDQRDPSVCRKYDIITPANNTDHTVLLLAILVPLAIIAVSLLTFLHHERKRRKEMDLVWKIDPSELQFDNPPRILGQGTFGFVLKAEYRGTEVAVKRIVPGGTRNATPTPIVKGDDVEQQNFPAVKPSPFDSVRKAYHAQGNEFPGTINNNNKNGAAVITTPFAMGQTMSVQASKAMVDQLMISREQKKKQKGSSKTFTWIMQRKGIFQNDQEKEYNKQRNDFVEEMRKLATLRHQCVITIMGAVLAKEDSMIVLEFMDHGSLYDVLHNETMALEGEIILPILRDIAQGIRFLHAATPQIIHCDLKSSNILVDGRFRAKVADFGLSTIETDQIVAAGTPYFLAPEILRGETGNTVASDAYAFGMVLYEVYSRKEPYKGEKPVEVLIKVADKKTKKRPPTPPSMPPKAETLMVECLCGDPRRRPTFEELDLQLKRLDTSTMEPLGQDTLDNKAEQARRAVLDNMVPKFVADAMREGKKVETRSGEHCSIFCSEICGFPEIAASLPPVKVADLLHRLYSSFDDLCGVYDIYKVDTINHSYMAITGLIKEQPDHAERIAEFSIAAVKVANETPVDLKDPNEGNVNIKVGVSTGAVVANVVGARNPRFCLFGDAVNTASRMEEHSEKNRIHCSELFAMLLEERCPSIPLMPRGIITVTGKGEMFTFFINEESADHS